MTIITETPTKNKQALDTSKAAPLGTVTSIVAAGEKTKYKRYSDLAHAQHLLIESNTTNTRGGRHRTRQCHAARAYQAETITIRLSEDAENSHASLAGVQCCGNLWGCPVCGTRIAVERGKEIRAALRWAEENGYQAIMLTFTASHHAGMSLVEFKSQFKSAYRALIQSRAWRNVKKLLEVKHVIKAVEPTLGNNGWHYHYHVLMFIKVETLRQLTKHELVNWRKDTRSLWLHELSKVGLSGIGKFALDFSFHGGVGENYLSKLGIGLDDVTDAGHELSGNANKHGKGATIWTILRRSQAANEDGKDRWSQKYVEYVRAMQGDNWITWSHGLKDLVGIEDISDQEAASTDENALVEWLAITDEQYRAVRKLRAYADLLELAAASRSKTAVLAYLVELKAVCDAKYPDNEVLLRQQYSWVHKKWLELHKKTYQGNIPNQSEIRAVNRLWSDVVEAKEACATGENVKACPDATH